MVAPEAGIRLDVEVWVNDRDEPLDQYAQHFRIGPDQTAVTPGGFMRIGTAAAYQATISDEHRYSPAPGQVIVTKQTRLLWLVPSLRSGRVIAIYATPAESSLRPVAEAAVSTFQLVPPATWQMPVTRDRDEILRDWLSDAKGAPIPGRRAEAKLVSYAEANTAFGPVALHPIQRNPDELFWLVAVSGPDLPPRRPLVKPGQSSATPPATTWIYFYTPATSENLDGTGSQASTTGAWPPTLNAFPDRCR